MNWQPIETAPKDGTHILLARTDSEWVCQGRYVCDDKGWYELNNDASDHWGGEIYPTHWMPLPEPPKDGESK